MDPAYLSPHDVKSDVSDQRLDHIFDQVRHDSGEKVTQFDLMLNQDSRLIVNASAYNTVSNRISKGSILKSDDHSEETKSMHFKALIENGSPHSNTLAIKFCNTDMSSKKSGSAKKSKDSDKISIGSSNTPNEVTPQKAGSFQMLLQEHNDEVIPKQFQKTEELKALFLIAKHYSNANINSFRGDTDNVTTTSSDIDQDEYLSQVDLSLPAEVQQEFEIDFDNEEEAPDISAPPSPEILIVKQTQSNELQSPAQKKHNFNPTPISSSLNVRISEEDDDASASIKGAEKNSHGPDDISQDGNEEATETSPVVAVTDEAKQNHEDPSPKPNKDELPEVFPPYLPKKGMLESEYTLVLDLDETLIHFVSSKDQDEKDQECLADLQEEEDDFFYMVRPFCNKFLNELSKFYEIVIYTAAMQDYADWIIQGIDSKGVIKHRLYRQHCGKETIPITHQEGEEQIHMVQTIKDLRLIGRDIKKTIIIDNLKENFESTCPNNGIEIISWYGYENEEDKELKNLMPFLKALVLNEEQDVRPVLKYYRNNYLQYVKDFVMPDQEQPQEDDQKRGPSRLASREANLVQAPKQMQNIEFIKNRIKMRKILDELDLNE